MTHHPQPGHPEKPRPPQEASSSFLQKRTKKLLRMAVPASVPSICHALRGRQLQPQGFIIKSFLLLFLHKEVLPFLAGVDAQSGKTFVRALRTQRIKVFWFFFSKKNCLPLSLSASGISANAHAEPAGDAHGQATTAPDGAGTSGAVAIRFMSSRSANTAGR